MMERQVFQVFILLIFFPAAVRGLNITRCLGPYNDSYTCPGLSDPPERTHCCLWNNQPACCLPGGSSCSNSVDKRNYCPRPNDGSERTHCCVWDSQPTCCLPRGSSCSDSAEKRNYCPGPSDESERTHCCVWNSQPTCCLPGGSSCSDSADIRNYCPGPDDGMNDQDCCAQRIDHGNSKPKCCRDRHLGLWIILGIWGFILVVVLTAAVVVYISKRC